MGTLCACFAFVVGLFFITNPCVAQSLDRNVFVAVNKKMTPSVVRIHTKGKRAMLMIGDDLKGSGSGFLITEGRVITNHHVIDKATDITVELHDGRIVSAEVLGSDETVDLAILKLKGSIDLATLVPARLGDSSVLEVGTMIAAIGNALDLGISITTGIVSARGRTQRDIGDIDLIQIDAAINHGNSGGPLVNLDGEVIGVNSAMMSGYTVTGIGFAIPINYVKDTLDQLSQGKKVGTGWIGALVAKPYEEDYQLFQLPSQPGVMVTQIAPKSPAENAGLLRNDFITHINKNAVSKPKDFYWIIRNAKDEVTLTLWRKSNKLTLSMPVIPEPKPDSPSSSTVPAPSGPLQQK